MGLMRLEAPCPACQHPGLVYNSVVHEIAYFGETLETLVLCEECGYRHADVLILRERDPVRYLLLVDSEKDLWARVVRSTSGTIRIPELGVLIEPGPASESFVSNVEGVLWRVDRVLAQLANDAEGEEERARCDERRELLQKAIAGAFPFTFVIEDPYGNSAVLHDEARKEVPSDEEVEAMKTGTTVFDIADLPPDARPEDLPLSEIDELKEGADEGTRRPRRGGTP